MTNKHWIHQFNYAAACIIFFALSSCSVFRPGSTSGAGGSGGRTSPDKSTSQDTRFIQSINTDNPDASGSADASAGSSVRAESDAKRPVKSALYRPAGKTPKGEELPGTGRGDRGDAPPLSVLQLKYSMLTNTPVSKLDNQKLLEFMDEWYGVPYRFGGTSKRGIDCSAFALNLMSDVYGLTSLPRISRDQYAASEKISRKKLREGDLVFFHTYGKGKTVTHVGVYLYNNRFVHASVSGVQIDDLEGSYYSRHFIGAGRVLE